MTEHIPVQIGRYDADGYRSFQTPGDVCIGCSDPDTGVWVPVSECELAWTRFMELERYLWHDGPRPTWLPEISQ